MNTLYESFPVGALLAHGEPGALHGRGTVLAHVTDEDGEPAVSVHLTGLWDKEHGLHERHAVYTAEDLHFFGIVRRDA